MNDFLTMRLIDPAQVTAGYYNTVTGEEHYHNPDTLMYGASTAKLPTNMVFAERVSKGEMTMDTLIRGNRYGLLQELSLINSDNPAQDTLSGELGGGNYIEFRKHLLPYIGEGINLQFFLQNHQAREIPLILQLLQQRIGLHHGKQQRFLQVSETGDPCRHTVDGCIKVIQRQEHPVDSAANHFLADLAGLIIKHHHMVAVPSDATGHMKRHPPIIG